MTYADVLVDLGRALRAAGVDAGPDQVRTLVQAVALLDPLDPAAVRTASRAVCCSSPAQVAVHDRVFDSFFRIGGPAPVPPDLLSAEPLPSSTSGRSGGEGEQALPIAAASRTEQLRKRDLAEASGTERDAALRLIDGITLTTPTRRSARRRPARRGSLDRRRTARQLLRTGGDVAALRYRSRVRTSRRVVVLVDVSGSMRPWVDVGLRFARRVVRTVPRADAFTAGTRLARITGALRAPTTAALWRGFVDAVPDFAGGTRLGDALAVLLDDWGRAGPLRGAVVVVVSDGWEHGGAEQLGHQMARLSRLAHRIIWLNPRSGRPGWAPETAGMRAVLPACDAVVAGHTVEDLQRAADLISNERRR